MKKLILVIAFFSAVTGGLAQRFNGSEGNQWYGGRFDFTTSSFHYKDGDGSSERINSISLSPILRFFPVNHFCAGPKISASGLFEQGSGIYDLKFGADLGVTGAGKVFNYLMVSPYYNMLIDDYGKENLFGLLFSGGLMIPLNDYLGLQIELGYTHEFGDGYSINAISIGFGICGFGKNTAVSFLNSGTFDFF